MRNLASRVTSGVAYACFAFALAVLIVGALGMWGVQSAIDVGRDLNRDELRSAVITSRLGLQFDAVYANGQRLAQSHPSNRGQLATTLYDYQIPAVEAQLASFKRIHEGDVGAEKADITKLVGQWAALRGVLNPGGSTLRGLRDSGLDARLTAAYQPLRVHIDALLTGRKQTLKTIRRARTRRAGERCAASRPRSPSPRSALLASVGSAADDSGEPWSLRRTRSSSPTGFSWRRSSSPTICSSPKTRTRLNICCKDIWST